VKEPEGLEYARGDDQESGTVWRDDELDAIVADYFAMLHPSWRAFRTLGVLDERPMSFVGSTGAQQSATTLW
jgi:hypothetical protein